MPLVSKSVGSRDDVDVATDEEERKDLKSGKKLCKIHDVKRTETWTRFDNVTVAQSESINLSPEHESSSTCPESCDQSQSEIKPAVSCVLNDVLKLRVKVDPIYGRSQVLENERITASATGPYISPEVMRYIDDAVDNEREEMKQTLICFNFVLKELRDRSCIDEEKKSKLSRDLSTLTQLNTTRFRLKLKMMPKSLLSRMKSLGWSASC